jgi:hypothetical protein
LIDEKSFLVVSNQNQTNQIWAYLQL